jgi:hypothetical protein
MSIQVEYEPIFTGNQNSYLMVDDFRGIAGDIQVLLEGMQFLPDYGSVKMLTGGLIRGAMLALRQYLSKII